MAWVNCITIYKSKELKRLGIKDIKSFNITLKRVCEETYYNLRIRI